MSFTAVILHSAKQLQRVAGMTLLERAVLSLRRGGASRVGLVVSPGERQDVERFLSGSRLASDPPELLVAPRGGDQARADVAAELVGTPDLLVRGPVAMDWGFVSGVLEELERNPDLEGSTAGGAIWIRPRAGDGSTQRLPVDRFGGTAVEVTDRQSARLARRTLLAQSIKPLHIDGIVCYLIIRRISVRISALLLAFPISPNMITGASILLGLTAAAAVGVGTYLWTAAGGALLVASLVLDNCDGEVARVKHQFSDWGAWFDIYGDFVVNASFMVGMAVGAWRRFDQPAYIFAGGFALMAFSVYNATVFRYIHRLGVPDEFLFKWWFDQEADALAARGEAVVAPGGDGSGPSGLGRFLSGLKYLGRRDFFIFAYLVTSLLGVLHWAFWVTVAGAAMNFVMICYQLFFWKGLSDGSGD